MNKNEKFMKWCIEGARIFSTCAKRQYMALIVDEFGMIESTGYNGVPSGMLHCDQGGCPRFKNNVPSSTPYDYGEGLCLSNHAEQNCLFHSDSVRRRNGTMYVNGIPCFGCSKAIANSGIKTLVYLNEEREFTGMDMLNECKINLIGLQG